MAYREILIDARQPLTANMAQIASIFTDAGWTVRQINGYNEVELVSPAAVGGRNLTVRMLIPTDETTSDVPHGSFKWGINLKVDTNGAGNFSPEFATTIFHGGVYTFIVTNLSFVIVPPETQPRRFAYGTWVSLLKPIEGLSLPEHYGAYTPLLVATDRIVGEKERRFPHIVHAKPTNFILFANGEISQEMRILHPQMGRKTVLQRDTFNYIHPFVLLIPAGGYFVPSFYAPNWFVEVNPKQPFYIATASSYDRGDFLAMRMLPFGVRAVACGELPPDGAKLISSF